MFWEASPGNSIKSEAYTESYIYYEESLENPPMEEWSSLKIEVPKENPKLVLNRQGLYYPDSEELCTKYVGMSRSSIFRHPVYHYTTVFDPGIEEALLGPEKKPVYTDDGQKLYMAVCNEMNQCLVKPFYKGLITDTINLKYYGINPLGVRAMAMALKRNKHVLIYDLTDNFLNNDACLHLAEMLCVNNTLRELNLSGCRIGIPGLKLLLPAIVINRGLRRLNLSKNQLTDEGITYVADIIAKGIDVHEIYLSDNNLTGKSANILGKAIEIFNDVTILDLSFNDLSTPAKAAATLLSCLSHSLILEELHLSWTYIGGVLCGNALKLVLTCPKLKIIDLNHNKLCGNVIDNIVENLKCAKNLITLNLSNNPLTPEDAVKIVEKMKLKAVKVQNLLMDNVIVNEEFLKLLHSVFSKKYKQNTVITYGDVKRDITLTDPDMRDVVLNRATYLSESPELTKGNKKKGKVDIARFMLQLLKDNNEIMPIKMFQNVIKGNKIPLDPDLIEEIANAFPGPMKAKEKTINIALLIDYIQRKWPDRLKPKPPKRKCKKRSSKKKKNKV